MSLTIEEVEHIAHLARLHLSEEEKQRYRGQLSSILDHVAQLGELDTANVLPLSGIVAERSPLRQDETGECLPPEKLLHNAPQVNAGQFRVPAVLDFVAPDPDDEPDRPDAD
jgi:aspartyl-tRNA(Asn)/glutamyl-tRNA(Gln) amidotransferase subunit C